MEDLETTIKVIVVGNGRVGKSSMTTRYCKNVFTDTYKKTIGVDFMEKTIELDEAGETVRLMIWDTAGQEEFDSLTSRYYKGAGAAVLVFSTEDRDSFDALDSWKRKVEDECGPIPMALVQNKIDLMHRAKMTTDEVEAAARRLGLRLYRACVKDNVNITEVFEYLTQENWRRGVAGGGAVASIADYSSAPAGSEASREGGAGAGSGGRDEAHTPVHSPGGPKASSPASHASSPGSPSHDDDADPGASDVTPGRGLRTAPQFDRPKQPQNTVKLVPSKVRTGNKKRSFCAVL